MDTGFNRNYQANPYDGYEKESSIMFPVRFRSEGYHPKEQVLGLVLDGKAKACPFVELAKDSGLPGMRFIHKLRFIELNLNSLILSIIFWIKLSVLIVITIPTALLFSCRVKFGCATYGPHCQTGV